MKLTAPDEDIIVYKNGNTYNTDKVNLLTNIRLSSHYSGKHRDETIEKIVVNKREVVDGILAKLTPLEKFIFGGLK